ncbi:MAG: hypothetical protein Q7S26_01370 [bacterium]|nr:hypothetical protein [bacterium]
MVTPQLLEYIRQQLTAKVGKEDIKKVLVTQGWTEQDIQEAFATVAPTTIAPPVASPQQISASSATPTKTHWTLIAIALVGLVIIVGAVWVLKTHLFGLTGPGATSTPVGTATSTYNGIQYLLFQSGGTYGPSSTGSMQQPQLLPKAGNEKAIDKIVDAIGERGDHVKRQLGIMFGPYTFDMTDAQVRQSIDDAFAIAEEKDVAVGFHIDDSMFWAARKDLWSVKDNVEWSDWKGTIVPHRIIGWVANGANDFLAPPMCYNSPVIIAEVKRLTTEVMGPEIVKGVAHLKSINKEYLFAGVIAGWETHIQDEGGIYYGTYGYCALHNLGYSANNPPKDFDTALAGVVNDWIVLWTKGLYDAGIPREKVYTHIAYGGEQTYGQTASSHDFNKQNPHSTAFNDYSYPGFSIYGTGFYSGLYKLLDANGGGPWGIAEGTAVGLGNSFNASDTTSASPMEGYLAGAFNHGAIYVDVFGWGDQGSAFDKATTGTSSIAAYQKFLRGETLIEAPVSASSDTSPASKIKKVMADLPAWIQAHPDRKSEASALLEKLEGYIKADDLTNASKTADDILSLIGEK